MGYDARVADEFKVFTNIDSVIVDPKNFDANSFVDRKTDCCIIPPNSFALARTVEYFRVPRDVLVICLGKSTYARCGIIVNVTPLEPGWEGHVTLEFSNTTPLPAKVYANEGACQFLFLQGNEPCEVSYADRAGQIYGPARGDAAQALRIARVRHRNAFGHIMEDRALLDHASLVGPDVQTIDTVPVERQSRLVRRCRISAGQHELVTTAAERPQLGIVDIGQQQHRARRHVHGLACDFERQMIDERAVLTSAAAPRRPITHHLRSGCPACRDRCGDHRRAGGSADDPRRTLIVHPSLGTICR